jgi:hypothetical protein
LEINILISCNKDIKVRYLVLVKAETGVECSIVDEQLADGGDIEDGYDLSLARCLAGWRFV